MVEAGLGHIAAFFGAPLPRPFTVRVFPDRVSLTGYWRVAWGDPNLESQCWMVASGTASSLAVLSPSAWKKDACEHDSADTAATRRLIAHELVHVYHGQVNPRPGFDNLDEIGWFVEGLAVFASGQLDEARLAEARKTIAGGLGPSTLADAWSGKARYGIAGSLAAYVDRTWGRTTTLRLMRCTSQKEILGVLGKSEAEILEGWRTDLLSQKS